MELHNTNFLSNTLVCFVLFTAFFSCQSNQQPETAKPQLSEKPKFTSGKAKKENYTIIETYFGTDRNAVEEENKLNFESERSNLKYGKCDVSIPIKHEIGNIERPSIWKLEFVEDPEKHVVVLNKEIQDPATFFKSIEEQFDYRAFLFVHGYNVSFEEAAQRTAQMAYDMSFDGIPFFYSWPSQGKTKSYVHDAQNIEYSVPHIEFFIDQIMRELPCHDLYIIAHSMGNRGLTKALVHVYEKEPYYSDRIKEVILTAPDIDAQIFKRDIAPNIVGKGSAVTLYASSHDMALKASKEINGYQRAGDSGNDIVVVEGIETIDASNIKTEFLGHSYFGDTRSVIDDIHLIIDQSLKADEREGLEKINIANKTYWMFE